MILFPTVTSWSLGNNKSCDCRNFCNEYAQNYLCFEFGINTIIAFEGKDYYKIIFCNPKNNNILIDCENESILQWAFEVLPNTLTDIQYIINNEYDPFYHRLTFCNDKGSVVIESSNMLIDDNVLQQKINELKTFMTKLWIENCVKN